jgi:hypothetical protein
MEAVFIACEEKNKNTFVFMLQGRLEWGPVDRSQMVLPLLG